MGDDNDQYDEVEGLDEYCHHYGIECEKPCNTHCPCDDCQDDEIDSEECEHEGDGECKHCGADLSQME